MHGSLSKATTLINSSSRWISGVVSGSIDVNPRTRTDDTYLPWKTDGAYGGMNGTQYFLDIPRREHTPLVMVHGNTGDAMDWVPMMEKFLDRGYTGEDLWAITFRQSSPSHSEMADQLDSFVAQIREFTGHKTIHTISHSLGVTGVRYWLDKYERHDWIDKFVGLAGANHGSSRCKVLADQGINYDPARLNWFLNPDNFDSTNHPLAQLNTNETPGSVEYYTLRAAEDRFFRNNPESPKLEGAENDIVNTDHDGLLTENESIENIYTWIADE